MCSLHDDTDANKQRALDQDFNRYMANARPPSWDEAQRAYTDMLRYHLPIPVHVIRGKPSFLKEFFDDIARFLGNGR